MLNRQEAGAADGGWNKDAGCGSCQGRELIVKEVARSNNKNMYFVI